MDNAMLSPMGLPDDYRIGSVFILALPLLSFLVNGLWLGRKSRAASGAFAALCMAATAALALWLALGYNASVLGRAEDFPAGATVLWERTWLTLDAASGLALKAGFFLDPIAAMMVVVVSMISFLVHVYSIGYMMDDASGGRFFPLLSLFTFSMLGLVVAPNLAQTYFFWELVGVSSYLLIGFWYHKPEAIAAAKKAFVLTRFADAFFLIGLLWVGTAAGGFDFSRLNSTVTVTLLHDKLLPDGFGLLGGVSVLTLTTLLIYIGAWGKSAMFPMHVWLPDAMEGPTPVSSLIHSATMVVAGVYLVARLFPLFSAAPVTMAVVEATGAFTALFAAVIACTQTDLKRILAFSTLSQLGYMMLSLGATTGLGTDSQGYAASMFHVFTHAFFKCLLFLSAGLVIHATHSNHILDAGGLRKRLPLTYAATWVACLAIAGVWPFAGFFSKERILSSVLANGHYLTFAVILPVGGLTAFYMFRMLFLVFHGPESHGNPHVTQKESHLSHEAFHGAESVLMSGPVALLAVPSLLIGWASEKFFLEKVSPWPLPQAGADALAEQSPVWITVAASLMAVAGIACSVFLYAWKRRLPDRTSLRSPAWYRTIANKFYVDEAYLFVIRNIFSKIGGVFSERLERKGLNGGFDQVTGLLRKAGARVNRIQNGQVQAYAAFSIAGLVLLLALRLLWIKASP